MEYANGVMEMFRIASDFGKDKTGRDVHARRRATAPVGLADRGAVRDQRAGDDLLHDGRQPRRRCSRRATSRPSSASRARPCGSTRPRRSSGSRSTPPATSRTTTTRPTRRRRTTTAAPRSTIGENLNVGGTGPGDAQPRRSAAPATFARSTPGVGQDYTASTTANVIRTAGDALISVADPSSTNTGKLVNGSFFLPTTLQAMADRRRVRRRRRQRRPDAAEDLQRARSATTR